MATRSRALALKGAACVAAALAVAGCSQTGSTSSTALTATGGTLHIYLSDPSNLSADPVAQDVIDAEKLAFTQHRSEVKDYGLQLKLATGADASDNARSAIEDNSAIAYIGEIAPGTSDQTVGITNALELLELSPTDTALELGQATPLVSGSPQSYYESWAAYGQTFARLVPSSAVEAKVQVAEMKALGVSKLYITSDKSDYGRAIAHAVTADAESAGITLATSISGSGAIFYGGDSPASAAKFFNGAATAAPTAKLFGPSALNSGLFTKALSSSVQNLYVTVPGWLPRQLSAAGKSFDSEFASAYGHKPNVEAIFGYAAMTQLLAVLHSAGGAADDRQTVVKDFLKTNLTGSVLGPYKIDQAGNSSLQAFVIAHLEKGTLVPFKVAPSQG